MQFRLNSSEKENRLIRQTELGSQQQPGNPEFSGAPEFSAAPEVAESTETTAEITDMQTPEDVHEASDHAITKANMTSDPALESLRQTESQVPGGYETVSSDLAVMEAEQSITDTIGGQLTPTKSTETTVTLTQKPEEAAQIPDNPENNIDVSNPQTVEGAINSRFENGAGGEYTGVKIESISDGGGQYRIKTYSSPEGLNKLEKIRSFAEKHGLASTDIKDGEFQITVADYDPHGTGFTGPDYRPVNEGSIPAEAAAPAPQSTPTPTPEQTVTLMPSVNEGSIAAEAAAPTPEQTASSPTPTPSVNEGTIAAEAAAPEQARITPENQKEASDKQKSLEVKKAEETLDNPEATSAERAEAINTLTEAKLSEMEEASAQPENKPQNPEARRPEVKEVTESKDDPRTDKVVRAQLMAEVRNHRPPKTVETVIKDKTDGFSEVKDRIDQAMDGQQRLIDAQQTQVTSLEQKLNSARRKAAGEKDSPKNQEAITRLETELKTAKETLQAHQKNMETMVKNLDKAHDKTEREKKMLDTMKEETVKLADRTDKKITEMGRKLVSLGDEETGGMVSGVRVEHDKSLGLSVTVPPDMVDRFSSVMDEKSAQEMARSDNPVPVLSGLQALIKMAEKKKGKA
ncbi:hypothetical protein A3C52_00585 [Candidatus Peribacteria bacterium RIFCSPHIGHO2_02_FULL_51_15]|nr:MAG: hypothetical protein A3C52_00585 [Candidatus Peribacteria bacterium RIFCSPHIGHO2_02_FULL_51_15]